VSRADVLVVGGGLAGLAAAIDCAEAGARVTLLEARPRLGGATWSLRRDGLALDNGQHVFLRCCTAYRELLARLGVEGSVTMQTRLDVPVADPAGRRCRLRRHALPSPAHLAPSLLRFTHLPIAARVRAGLTARRVGELDLEDFRVDEESLGGFLAAHGESDDAIDCFWDLLVRPTLNLPARDASLALAAKVFQTGLLGDVDAADIGWASVPLEDLHARPAAALLAKRGAEVRVGARVARLGPIQGDRRIAVLADASEIAADAVILATDHEHAAALLPPDAPLDAAALRGLGTAPIVNLYVAFDRPVLDVPLLAAVRSPVQWIFDRTDSSGLATGQMLAISLSAADAYLGRTSAELESLFLPELARLLPACRGARREHFSVVREPAATFRQRPGTRKLRPAPGRLAPGLFLAGAWTDTGWPATMEGAVRSGRAAARDALASLERARAQQAA
jgi:squalene-associated FAD-dependent desaturase